MASPPKRKSIIYIDGFNLFYGAIKNTPFAWLDIEKLFTTLRRDDNIQTIYYFTAEMQGEKKQARQKQYLNALDTLPLVTRIDGHFKNKTVKCLFPGGTSKRKAPLLIHTIPEHYGDMSN